MRVSLFERERMFQEWLAHAFAEGGVEVVASYRNVSAFVSNFAIDKPDVAVADLRESGDDHASPALLREARERHPGVPVLVLSSFAHPTAESCYREGAAAWVDTATQSTEDLIAAAHQVAHGVRLFPLDLAASGMGPQPELAGPPLLSELSERERQVLSFIGLGADNLKISAHLGIRERTVKSHVTNLYRKSHAENRSQLALLARELGLRARP